MADLKTIPEYFYDAARVNGASDWQVARRVTIPLLTPITLLLVVVNTSSAFKVFTQVFVMGQQGAPTSAARYLVARPGSDSHPPFRRTDHGLEVVASRGISVEAVALCGIRIRGAGARGARWGACGNGSVPGRSAVCIF